MGVAGGRGSWNSLAPGTLKRNRRQERQLDMEWIFQYVQYVSKKLLKIEETKGKKSIDISIYQVINLF